MKNYFVTQLLLLNTANNHFNVVAEYLQQEEPTLKAAAISQHPNIAIYNQAAETLKIETVRTIIKELAYSSYQGKKRWYILLHTDLASIPAQNALLKVVEEPPQNTQIILTCNDTTNLLPTILSRCQVVTAGQLPQTTAEAGSTAEAAREIFAQWQKQELNYSQATQLAKEHKDRDTALALTTDLLQLTNQALDNDPAAPQQLVTIGQTLLDTRTALQQNLNTRLALEHLFFTIIRATMQA